MVGRERVFSDAVTFLSGVYEGVSPGALRYWAEAGTGKTRLIEELRNSESNLEFLIISAENTSTSSPFRDYLSHWVGRDSLASTDINTEVFRKIHESFLLNVAVAKDRRTDALIGELNRTESILMSMSGIEPEAGSLFRKLQPGERYKNQSAAILAYMRAKSLLCPLVIVFENIQWFNAGSLDLVKDILSQCSDYPIAFILTSRPGENGKVPDFPVGEGAPKGKTVFLEGLPYSSIGDFITNLNGMTPDSPLVDFVWERAGGLPLFIEQVMDYLDESNLIRESNGNLSLTDESEIIPDTISDIFLARIKLLPEQTARMLGAGAITGMEFTSGFLSEILQEDISSSVTLAVDRKIFTENDDTLYFSHELFRESSVLLNTLETNEHLHYRAGEILEKITSEKGGNPSMYESIGNHFQISGRNDRAVCNLAKAAEGYSEIFYNKKAISLYKRLFGITADREKVEFELALADIYRTSGLHRDAIELLGKTLKTVSGNVLISDELIALVKLQYASHLGFLGKTDEAEILLMELLPEFESMGDILRSAIVLRRVLMIKITSGKPGECSELITEAMKYCRKTGVSAEICSTLYWIVGICRRTGRYDEMKKYAAEMVLEAEKTGNLKSLISGYSSMMSYHIYNLDYDKAKDCHVKLTAVAEETGNLSALTTAVNKMGIVHTRLEEFDEAMSCFEKVASLAKKTGSIRSMCGALGNIAGILLNLERYDEAQKYTQQLIDKSSEIGFKLGILSGYARMVPIFMKKGAYETALDCAKTHLEIAIASSDARNTSDAYHSISTICFILNKPREALINVDNALLISTEIKEKRLIGVQNLSKSRILIELGEFEQALEAVESVSDYYAGVETKAREKFKCLLYSTFLKAVAGDTSASNRLLEMLPDAYNDNDKADIYYYHYLATDSADSASKARAINKNLCEKTPSPIIAKRML